MFNQFPSVKSLCNIVKYLFIDYTSADQSSRRAAPARTPAIPLMAQEKRGISHLIRPAHLVFVLALTRWRRCRQNLTPCRPAVCATLRSSFCGRTRVRTGRGYLGESLGANGTVAGLPRAGTGFPLRWKLQPCGSSWVLAMALIGTLRMLLECEGAQGAHGVRWAPWPLRSSRPLHWLLDLVIGSATFRSKPLNSTPSLLIFYT